MSDDPLRIFEPGFSGPSGIELIRQERNRQISEEGYDANHDDGDGHDGGELAQAAAAYALGGGQITNIFEDRTINIWPTSWGAEGDTIKRKPRIRQLVIAGALIVAEIERLQRADGDATATSSPAPAEKLPLPTDYECIAPSEQIIVINLLRGICDAGKQVVARRHLSLCARCQELAGGVVPGARVAEERESLTIEGNREEAIKLLRQLREAADPEEIQRQKESWVRLEAALNPTAKGDR